MSLSFLRILDRWAGSFLLCILALPAYIIRLFSASAQQAKQRYVFLKLKGGGSLIVAMPALLGLRRANPQAEFILVCAREAKLYAELTGIFDRFTVIDDASIFTLVHSGYSALRDCFRASFCLDLEPNSWFAALFTMLVCAQKGMGLVRQEQPQRALAYSAAISYNIAAPIYLYYDRICEMLGALPASTEDCRAALQAFLPPPPAKAEIKIIALSAFTSDFMPERMMPKETWGALMEQSYPQTQLRILIFGSMRDRARAQQLCDFLQKYLPTAIIENLAGADSLAETASRMTSCDEIWAVDSGLLHIARLLGIQTRSFWGPTMPTQRLRPIASLAEHISYRPFLCSPCIQSASKPPCSGNNLCMKSMAEEAPDLHPIWARNHKQ